MASEEDGDLSARAQGGDAPAAFELGRRQWPVDAAAGDAWFKAAVRASDLRVMHDVIDVLEANPSPDDGLVGVWKRRAGIAGYPRTDAPHIHVALSVFAPIDERGRAIGEPDPRLVVQAADPAAAATALRNAADSAHAAEPPLDFSAERSDEQGAHLTVTSALVAFRQQLAFVDGLISELVGSGIRAAYIRPETSDAWLPQGRSDDPALPDNIARAAQIAKDETAGESAFTVGSWCSAHTYRQHGEAWFKEAAAHAPFPMLLRIIDFYALEHPDWNGDRLTGWMARACRLEFPRTDASGIRVLPSLFAPIVLNGCAGYGHDTTVQVLCDRPSSAAAALRNASRRFALVTADGRVFPDLTALEQAEPDNEDDWANYYSPNFISEIEFDGPHPYIWMDWKDNMAPRMARAMTHILIDELLDHGVTQAFIRARPK